MRINDDWDALGMRASGSHSVTLRGRRAAAGGAARRLPGRRRARRTSSATCRSGLFHASASLGIAEAAFARATQPERIGDDARGRMLVAESAIDLSAARAALARAARADRRAPRRQPGGDGTEEEIIALFAEGQAAKTFVSEAATRVVDRALALSGGAGYLNGSPLARAYRDVRAGAFMHPLGANRAYDFLADVALGRHARPFAEPCASRRSSSGPARPASRSSQSCAPLGAAHVLARARPGRRALALRALGLAARC